MTLEINVYAYVGILVAWLVAEWFVVRYIKSQEREACRQEMLGFVMVYAEFLGRCIGDLEIAVPAYCLFALYITVFGNK